MVEHDEDVAGGGGGAGDFPNPRTGLAAGSCRCLSSPASRVGDMSGLGVEGSGGGDLWCPPFSAG